MCLLVSSVCGLQINTFTGASANIQGQVIIENKTETTFSFIDGSAGAYLGYVTVQYNPEPSFPGPQNIYYALLVTDETSPTVERCNFSSCSQGGVFCSHFLLFLFQLLQSSLHCCFICTLSDAFCLFRWRSCLREK